jgi:hypothetical protein
MKFKVSITKLQKIIFFFHFLLDNYLLLLHSSYHVQVSKTQIKFLK